MSGVNPTRVTEVLSYAIDKRGRLPKLTYVVNAVGTWVKNAIDSGTYSERIVFDDGTDDLIRIDKDVLVSLNKFMERSSQKYDNRRLAYQASKTMYAMGGPKKVASYHLGERLPAGKVVVPPPQRAREKHNRSLPFPASGRLSSPTILR